jgi:hypothetical protein
MPSHMWVSFHGWRGLLPIPRLSIGCQTKPKRELWSVNYFTILFDVVARWVFFGILYTFIGCQTKPKRDLWSVNYFTILFDVIARWVFFGILYTFGLLIWAVVLSSCSPGWGSPSGMYSLQGTRMGRKCPPWVLARAGMGKFHSARTGMGRLYPIESSPLPSLLKAAKLNTERISDQRRNREREYCKLP